MNNKTVYILLLSVFLFDGCSEIVTKYYPTRAKAEEDNLFEKGWLPSIIPKSATDITTSIDLDINTSKGDFRYAAIETNAFLSHLKPYSVSNPDLKQGQSYFAKQRKDGYDAFEFIANKTVWIFLVNTSTNHVRYVMRLQNGN